MQHISQEKSMKERQKHECKQTKEKYTSKKTQKERPQVLSFSHRMKPFGQCEIGVQRHKNTVLMTKQNNKKNKVYNEIKTKNKQQVWQGCNGIEWD